METGTYGNLDEAAVRICKICEVQHIFLDEGLMQPSEDSIEPVSVHRHCRYF